MKTLSLNVVCFVILTTLVPFVLEAEAPTAREQLQSLEVASSLDRAGMLPWHLRLSFDLFKLEGNGKKESGTIEEWWDSPNHHRIVITSPSFDSNQQTTQPYDREVYLVHLLLQQVVHPVPHYGDFHDLEVVGQDTSFLKTTLSCITVARVGTAPNKMVRGEWPEFCIEPNSSILRIHFDQGQFSAIRNHLGTFLSTSVAVDNTLNYRGRIAISGHIDTLQVYHPAAPTPEPADKAEDALDVPAVTLAGKIVKKVAPIYPEMAKMKRLGGTVTLCGVISKQGTFSSLDVVASPDPLFSESALDAVRKWTYTPYLLNGSPTSVETTITVNFNLN